MLRAAGPELGVSAVGEILKGAALLDDIIALVLLSVLVPLSTGGGSTSNLGWTIGRPIVASAAMAIATPLLTVYIFRPIFRTRRLHSIMARGGHDAELFVGVAALCAFLAIASYAGTTMLLGAFLAGYFLSALPKPDSSVSFVACWEAYLLPIQEYVSLSTGFSSCTKLKCGHTQVLVPIFFISIGFSIPFLDLWTGTRIWRGLVYAILMTLGKLFAGLPIILAAFYRNRSNANNASVAQGGEAAEDAETDSVAIRDFRLPNVTSAEKLAPPLKDDDTRLAPRRDRFFLHDTLPAAAFVGLALVARGEIGVSPETGRTMALCALPPPFALRELTKAHSQVLVLQVARSASAESSSPTLGEPAYISGIWAVAICTILGPVAFGVLIKHYGERIKTGTWGIA